MDKDFSTKLLTILSVIGLVVALALVAGFVYYAIGQFYELQQLSRSRSCQSSIDLRNVLTGLRNIFWPVPPTDPQDIKVYHLLNHYINNNPNCKGLN